MLALLLLAVLAAPAGADRNGSVPCTVLYDYERCTDRCDCAACVFYTPNPPSDIESLTFGACIAHPEGTCPQHNPPYVAERGLHCLGGWGIAKLALLCLGIVVVLGVACLAFHYGCLGAVWLVATCVNLRRRGFEPIGGDDEDGRELGSVHQGGTLGIDRDPALVGSHNNL